MGLRDYNGGSWNDQYKVNRKTFRKNQLKMLSEQTTVHTLHEVIGSMKKVVLMAKMGDDKFANKTVTGNHKLEQIINEMVTGESVTEAFVKWFAGYDSHKGDFIKLSLMFRPFLPKITQKILGEVYDFAKKYLPKFSQYKSFQQRAYHNSNFNEEDVYYDNDGCRRDDRLKPLPEYAYINFFAKVFKKRHPELWYIVQPHIPIVGITKISIGQGGPSYQFVSVKDRRIVVDMESVIAILSDKINNYDDEKSPVKDRYVLLRSKARSIADDNN